MKRIRLKYYMRALGIGIIVTALLMGYSQRSQAEMTDEEILQRAAELGMTEPQPGVLADIATASPKPTEEPEPTAAPTATSAATSAVQPVAEPSASPQPDAESTTEPVTTPAAKPEATSTEAPEATPTEAPTATPTAAPTATPTAAPTATPTEAPTTTPTVTPAATPTDMPTAAAPAGDMVTLVISRGESSVTVSRNLQELGLVEDYKVFDRYLCDNGYDKSISTGTYEIPVGSTEEEIADIISKKR